MIFLFQISHSETISFNILVTKVNEISIKVLYSYGQSITLLTYILNKIFHRKCLSKIVK